MNTKKFYTIRDIETDTFLQDMKKLKWGAAESSAHYFTRQQLINYLRNIVRNFTLEESLPSNWEIVAYTYIEVDSYPIQSFFEQYSKTPVLSLY